MGLDEADAVPVKMEFSTVPGLPPRYTIENIVFAPSPDRLVVQPANDDAELLNTSESYTRTILSKLSHTPVSAFGENFEFSVEDPPASLLDVFNINDDLNERIDETFDFVSTSVISSVSIRGGTLNITRSFQGGAARVKFNFHYNVESAAQAEDLLKDSFLSNYELAKAILQSYED